MKQTFENLFFTVCLFLQVIFFISFNSDIQAQDNTSPPSTFSVPLHLTAYKILPINSEELIEPSGLAFWQNRLVTIDDKTDENIYEIIIKENEALINPFLKIDLLEKLPERLDFEGITVYENNFYIVSETYCKILEVKSNGEARWIPLDIKKYGKKQGMLSIDNAGFEGVTSFNNGHFLLAAERQPRGLIEVQTNPLSILGFQILDKTEEKLPEGVPPDFADLCYYSNKLWAIFRNANQIVELKGEIGSFKVINRYYFGHIFLNSQYCYTNMKFGLAEGLAVDDKYFYIVLDNNKMAFTHNPKDRRPLLLIFERP